MHIDNDATCVACNSVITNPICPSCIGLELNQWLAEKTHLAVSAFSLPKADIMGIRCVVCNSSMNYCAQCFTIDAMSDMVLDDEERQEVATFFDYPFGG